ncbi:hypothetical protein AMTRI_Chr03g47620 [Amborella trichopoda]
MLASQSERPSNSNYRIQAHLPRLTLDTFQGARWGPSLGYRKGSLLQGPINHSHGQPNPTRNELGVPPSVPIPQIASTHSQNPPSYAQNYHHSYGLHELL